MEVGVILAIKTRTDNPQPLVKVYEEFLDDAVYGEQLGFESAWTSEHHFAPDCWSPSQLPILANLAARTSTMRLGTNVFLMPFHHPLRVAEDVATVDILSNGRLDLVVGSGSIEDEFTSFGLDPQRRWGMLFESLGIVRRCFAEDAFDHEGKYWTLPNVRMTTKPVQKPFPLWVAGGGPKLLERAGREGYHLQGGMGQQQIYYDALVESGRDPDDFNYQNFLSVHIAPTNEQAWDECEAAMHAWQSMYYEPGRKWIAWGDAGPPPLPPIGELRKDPAVNWMAAIGSPDEVMGKLEMRFKGGRSTHLGIAFRLGGGMDTTAVRRSMKLFADEMLPEVKKWGRDPIRSEGARP